MHSDLTPAERAKRAAAARALELVTDGMALGLGSGSTAAWFVDLLAPHLAGTGKRVRCVATSARTAGQATGLGIPLISLDEAGRLDLTVDGADEIDGRLDLIKGGGGALLQEKIVACASERLVVIADASKEVAALGAFPLPVEVVRFAWATTAARIERVLARHDVAARDWRLREADGAPCTTDEGHLILDLALGRIGDAPALHRDLALIPGVVETGLFCGIAALAIVGEPDGSARIVAAPRPDATPAERPTG